jgi:hypothetical protein
MKMMEALERARELTHHTGWESYVGYSPEGEVTFTRVPNILAEIWHVAHPDGSQTTFGTPQKPENVPRVRDSAVHKLLAAISAGVVVVEGNTLRNTISGKTLEFPG